jgi:hypothetical protein
MGQQLANAGLMSDKVNKAKIKGLNLLEVAQLRDCLANGQTVQLNLKRSNRKQRSEAPLFGESSPIQSSLF